MFTFLAIAPTLITVLVAAVAALVGLVKARSCAARTVRLRALDLRAKRRWQREQYAACACVSYTDRATVQADYWRSEALGLALLASD